MAQHQQALAAIIVQDPNVDSFMSTVGAGGPNVAGNSGRMFLRLKPRDQRRLSADELIQSLRPKLAAVPGIRFFCRIRP